MQKIIYKIMSKDAKVFQSMPKYTKVLIVIKFLQSMPLYVKVCQIIPKHQQILEFMTKFA